MQDRCCSLGTFGCLHIGTDMDMPTKVLYIALNIRAFRTVKSICLPMNSPNSWNLCGMLMYGLLMVPKLCLGSEINVTEITSEVRLLTRISMLALHI